VSPSSASRQGVIDPMIIPGVQASNQVDSVVRRRGGDGPLWTTRFHPEKSDDPGAQLLCNWIGSL
jgi:hypothetical protein